MPPTTDPNPPATQPDTTVNGGSDFSGGAGRAYVNPDTINTANRVSNKETATAGSGGSDGNLNGPDSSRTVNAPQTSGTDGRTASGAVQDVSYTGTLDTTKSAYDRDGGTGDPAYSPPPGDTPGSNVDTTLTSRRTDVPDDNNPNAIPSGYVVNQRDTSGVHTAQGGAVPFTPPGAPSGVSATAVPNRREVVVQWTPGTAPVGAPVKRWLVQGNTTGSKIVPAHEHQTVMSEGLVGGDVYRFTVYAETDLGTGYRSAPSNAVTVSKGDITSDVDYVEDDRAGRYSTGGTYTPQPDET